MKPGLAEVRRELARIADHDRAPAMQAYMKSEMPYHGVSSVPFRALVKKLFLGVSWSSGEAFRDHVLALWRGARFREERYAAIELSGVKAARGFQDLDALPMYEEMIVTGAWWDYVDVLAQHRVGPILSAHPKEMKRTLREWSRCDDIWKRRTAIIAQNFFKEETDLPFLYECIEPSIDRKEFWLRKAIGWALRQYAYTDPDEVLRFVTERKDELSPLSKREGLKTHLRNKKIAAIP